MSSKTLQQVWLNSKAKGGPRLLLVCMADESDSLGYCNPSMGLLAHRTKLTRRHVVNMIADLEAMRELFVWRQRGASNRYILRGTVSQSEFLESVTRHFWLTPNVANICWQTNRQPTSEKISHPTSEKISHPTSEIISPTAVTDFTPDYNKEPSKKNILINTWLDVLSVLEATTDKQVYKAHFQNSQLIKLNKTEAVILVPSSYSAAWINERLGHIINSAMADIIQRPVNVTASFE